MQEADSQHVKRLVEGSYEDFTILYNRYFTKLYGFIYGLIRSHTIAEDIVQETFVKIWTIRENIQPDSSFQAFIFTIARNKLISEIRSQTGNKQFLDYMEVSNSVILSNNDLYEKLDYEDFCKKINAAKIKLTPRQLEIFELNIETGFSTLEIANKLSISERTIQNQLSLALRTIREQLKNVLSILPFI
jgi:RNA polymerase sigma-70 factor (ECF subfamily)